MDAATGRGVPLVELETTNLIRLVTDSNGVVAFYEPGLMGQKVYFYIKSHGYEYPKDGFGYRGKAFAITPGGSATAKMKRLNISERLYRVTGQGIYRDSVLTGQAVPLKNPAVNGLVMGQDSVQTCFYRNRLYWFWGDTSRPSYPLGHFATAGAVTLLPEQGGLDPALGVALDYFVDKTGFSKKMFPVSEPGMIWFDGVLTAAYSAIAQDVSPGQAIGGIPARPAGIMRRIFLSTPKLPDLLKRVKSLEKRLSALESTEDH